MYIVCRIFPVSSAGNAVLFHGGFFQEVTGNMTLDRIIITGDPLPVLTSLGDKGFQGRALEIGFGNGEFIEHMALQRPQSLFVGIEISMNCVMKAVKRVKRSNLSNVRIIMGDARFLLKERLPLEWFDKVYMNFPCPWPKKRHARRRVTASGFSDMLAGVLATGGVFELVTDDGDYAREAALSIPRNPALCLERFEADPERKVQTKYERKWLGEGKNIFLLSFLKNKGLPNPGMKKGVLELHKAFQGPCPHISVVAALKGHKGGERDARWVFRDAYASSSGVILVEALSSDEGFEQSFFFRIVPREGGCMLKVDAASRPFTTPAVSGAFQDLGSLLENREL
jgi:tRNA (guanine-N7-)-methyltransferase